MSFRKGTIDIKKTKKGKLECKILFTNKKGKQAQLHIGQENNLNESYNGKEIDYKLDDKGLLIKIKCGEEILFPGEKPCDKVFSSTVKKAIAPCKHLEYQNAETISNPAAAPYNFVSLNTEVVPSERIPDFGLYHSDRYTGWIDLDVVNLTPIYVRDTMTETEMKAKENAPPSNPYKHAEFYSPAGKYGLPGSSVRGLCRSTMEIVSFGLLEFFEKEKKLYFRTFADKSNNIREAYNKRMLLSNDECFSQKSKAGFLMKTNYGSGYKIIPAKIDPDQRVNYYKVEEKTLLDLRDHDLYPEKMRVKESIHGKEKMVPNDRYHMINREVYFKNSPEDWHDHSKGNRPLFLFYGKVSHIMSANKEKQSPGWKKGTLVCTGWAPSKRMHFVINEMDDSSKAIEVAEDVIENYRNDATRGENINLLNKLIKIPNGVPCFYISHNDEAGNEIIDFFGHTGMFRLYYERTIKEHVPEVLWKKQYRLNKERLKWINDEPEVPETVKCKLDNLIDEGVENDKLWKQIQDILKEKITNKSKRKECACIIEKHTRMIDIPGAIFGNTELFSGRVFFEDVLLCDGQMDLNYDEKWMKVLSSPKETCLQHYLVQSSADGNQLQHYDDCSAARGYKQYWHGKGDENKWIENNGSVSPTVNTKAKPIKPNKKFKGRIRFENLTKVEVGALLFSLQLPEGCFHKIGMGKPLGLGTIHIKPKLYLSDRRRRYSSMFAEWEDQLTATPQYSDDSNEDSLDNFKKAFENYILKNLGEEKADNLWDLDRLATYKILLDREIGIGLENKMMNRYMTLAEDGFKSRYILPTPAQLAKMI